MTNFDLIFDNGGGITLQTADYCHHFNGREKEAAECVSEILNGEDPNNWDGNEPDHRMEYGYDMEQNGGYKWVSDNDVLEAIGQLLKDDRAEWLDNISGGAEREFFEHLFTLRDEEVWFTEKELAEHVKSFGQPSLTYGKSRLFQNLIDGKSRLFQEVKAKLTD